MGSTKTNFEQRQAWEAVRKQTIKSKPIPNVRSMPVLQKGPAMFFRIAAAFIAVTAVGLLVYWMATRNLTADLVAENSILQETLKDGSEVTLDRRSTLTYTPQFNRKERRVQLSGSALFKVTPNADKPFIVETPEVNVQVLGTSFYVRARESEQEIDVVVEEGSVSVTVETGETITLEENEMAVFDKQKAVLAKKINRDQNYLAWKTKRLVFENTPLEAVCAALSRAYDVDVQLANTYLRDCNLTATYENYSLDDVLMLIRETLNLRTKKKGRLILLDGEECN
jgi:ferric-dicitrate binding protein FerR (iron transport regulator)